MTELQKKNFEHTQQQLAAADAVVKHLTEQKKSQRETLAYTQRKLSETNELLTEAERKAATARERFEAVIEEIAPEPIKADGNGFVFLGGVPLPRFVGGEVRSVTVSRD